LLYSFIPIKDGYCSDRKTVHEIFITNFITTDAKVGDRFRFIYKKISSTSNYVF